MIKILVVDDMLQWRNFHKSALFSILKNVEFEITIKNFATEAFDVIQENIKEPYDLIITDLQMETDYEPDYAGEWLVKQIQKYNAYKTSKIIIASAAYNIKIIAENLGVSYIQKQNIISNLLSYELKIKELLNC